MEAEGSSEGSFARRFGYIPAYFRANVASAIEYRSSLIIQVFGMFINDAMWVSLWMLYFQRFPVIRGWGLQDVLVLWATVTFSWGLAAGICGSATRLAGHITSGQLDYYLVLPKSVLPHLLVSELRLVNLGDMLFGPVLLFLFVDLTPSRVLIFFVASLLAAIVTLSFLILAGSTAFFLGSSETLSFQMINMLITFSTYPGPIFTGMVKTLLYSVIPAGFISTLPVELVREFRWQDFSLLLAGAGGFLALALGVFHLGLKRYESGNLIQMRS